MSNEKIEHEVGDIMFFSPYLFVTEYEKNKKTLETSDWGQKRIKQMHKTNLRSQEGSDWVSHVGVICSDEENGLHIAHATEVNVEHQNETHKGYVKELLSRELSRYKNENEDRSFIFFKPNGEEILNKIEAYFGKEFVLRHGLTAAIVAQELGEEIGKSADSNYHKELEEISWNYSAGLKAIFNPGKLKEDRIINLGKQKVQDTSTICSEFGTRALKIGSLNYFKRLYEEAQKDIELGKKVSLNIKLDIPFEKIKIRANQIPGYPHTKSNNTPKGVMHSLIHNSDYKKHYYLGKFPSMSQQKDYHENKYHIFATTLGYNAPEVFTFKQKKIDVDKIHAYILGKNLYVYVTGNSTLYDKNVGTRESDFDHPVFKTKQGKALQSIIMALVQPESDKRMLLEKVPERLFQIRLKVVLGDLEALKFGVNDKPMNDYIEEKMKQIKMAGKNLASKEQILMEMQNTVNALKSNLPVPEIKEMIKSYFLKNNVEIDTNIESVISELSLHERIHLLRSLKIKSQLETEQKNEQIDTTSEKYKEFMEHMEKYS